MLIEKLLKNSIKHDKDYLEIVRKEQDRNKSAIRYNWIFIFLLITKIFSSHFYLFSQFSTSFVGSSSLYFKFQIQIIIFFKINVSQVRSHPSKTHWIKKPSWFVSKQTHHKKFSRSKTKYQQFSCPSQARSQIVWKSGQRVLWMQKRSKRRWFGSLWKRRHATTFWGSFFWAQSWRN